MSFMKRYIFPKPVTESPEVWRENRILENYGIKTKEPTPEDDGIVDEDEAGLSEESRTVGGFSVTMSVESPVDVANLDRNVSQREADDRVYL